MRIAVTGSGGFIGQNLVSLLVKSGYEVIEISRNKGLDICNWESVKDIEGCSFIIHLAAQTFVPSSFNDPREFYQVNTNATINALELARLNKARVIYMSSYFYGAPKYVPVDEDHPLKPHNPYAQTKYISEELCQGYHRDFNVPVITFRLFNIYGPGQKRDFLIPEILEKIKSGKVVLKDPRPKRDYIHVDDVVSAILQSVEKRVDGYHIFNLGSGKSWSVEELVNILKEISPTEFDIEFTHEYRKGEVLDSVADTTKLTSVLGWENGLSLFEGLKTLV